MLRRLFLKTEPLETASGPDRPVPGEPPLFTSHDPPLVLLVPGVAGVSIYQMRSFRDAHSAAAFIESCNPYHIYREGIIAFWATHVRPPQQSDAECAVLVRTEPGSDLVHPYAFADAESATSYIRFRVDETGEPLESFILYWASSIRINANPSGEVRLEPSSPPRVRRQPKETPREARPIVLDESAPVVAPDPIAGDRLEFETRLEERMEAQPQLQPDETIAEVDPPPTTDHSGVAPSSSDLPTTSETRWSRRSPPRALGARIKAHALALGLLGYTGREVENELRAMFPGDRIPSHTTIIRWLRRAGISRSKLKRLETMSEQAIHSLEKRLSELDGAPLHEVARVVELLESIRRK